MSDIFDEIKRFEREMDLLLSNFMSTKKGMPYSSGWRPPVNIFEKEDSLIVMVEAAGVKPDNIKVVLDNNILTISGKREDPFAGDSRNFYTMEISFGTFERRISLPYKIDTDRALVKNKEGFIQIILPRVESDRKVIEIEEE